MSRVKFEMTWSDKGQDSINKIDNSYHDAILAYVSQLLIRIEKMLRDLYKAEVIRLHEAAGETCDYKDEKRDLAYWKEQYQGLLAQEGYEADTNFEAKINHIDRFYQKVNDTLKNLTQIAIDSSREERYRFSQQPDLWANTSSARRTDVINKRHVAASETAIRNMFKDLESELPSLLRFRKRIPGSVDHRQENADLRYHIKRTKALLESNRKTSKRQLWHANKNDEIDALACIVKDLPGSVDYTKRTARFRHWIGRGLTKIKVRGHTLPQSTINNWFPEPVGEIQKIKDELAYLRGLHGDFDTLPNGQDSSGEASFRLKTGYDALRAHRRVEKLQGRLRKLQKRIYHADPSEVSEDVKINLAKQTTRFAESTKRFLDPYYKHGKWTRWDKARLITKLICMGGAAVCAAGALGCALAALAFPPAILGTPLFVLGMAGLIGIEPLLDTFIASTINYFYYGRAAITPQAIEMSVGGTLFPVLVATGFGTHLGSGFLVAHAGAHTTAYSVGNGMNQFSAGFSNYGMNGFGATLNPIAAILTSLTVGRLAFKTESRKEVSQHSHIDMDCARKLMLDDVSTIDEARSQWFKIYPEAYLYRKVKDGNPDIHETDSVDWIKSKPSNASKIGAWKGFSMWHRGLAKKYSTKVNSLKTYINETQNLAANATLEDRLEVYRGIEKAVNELADEIKANTDKLPKELQKLQDWVDNEVRVLESISPHIEKVGDNTKSEDSMGSSTSPDQASGGRLNLVLTARG